MAFLYRLLPPRPTYHPDMSATEAETMEAHGAYWMDLLVRGTAVAYGPVFDPAGVWGLAILDVEEEPVARGLVDSDPAVASGICTYVLLEMQLAKPGA
jgi:uncharacterized protein